MHYSVCLPAVLGKRSISEAMACVREAGFSHYEIWNWDGNVELCLEAQQREGLVITALCTRMISLTDPMCRTAYMRGLQETVEVCHKLGCKTIISQVGQELEGLTREKQHESIVKGLSDCVALLRENDLTLVIEPLNTRIDHRGYYLWSSKEAFQIVDEVGDEHVKVLYDLYHQYVMNDLDLKALEDNIHKIGHFHMAGYPGRHEPMINSEIPYLEILRTIKQSGYQGAIGLEYFPMQDARQSLQQLYGQLNKI